MLAGTNVSDDLFMFITTKLGGLEPNTKYNFSVDNLTIATNVPKHLSGIGGAPGESVFIKAGSYKSHPERVLQENYITTKFDHGRQSQDGVNAIKLGDFAKENDGDHSHSYKIKTLTSQKHIVAESNEKGEMWLFFATDSGFEGRSEPYFISADISLESIGMGGILNPDNEL